VVWEKIDSEFLSLVELGPYRTFYDNMFSENEGFRFQRHSIKEYGVNLVGAASSREYCRAL
jgi:hypothetical protein